MKAVVLSDPGHLSALKELDFADKSFRIYTHNAGLYPELKKHCPDAVLLDDFSVQSEWDTVNAWGCEKAYGWIRFCSDRGIFKDFDIPSATALLFSHLLVQGVKNLLFAEQIIAAKPTEIIYFPVLPRVYPQFSGTGYLNFFLSDLAQPVNIPLRAININITCDLPTSKYTWRDFAKKTIKEIAPFFLSSPGRADLVVVGSWKHHHSLVSELQGMKKKILFYEDEFRGDLFRKVKKAGAAYSIASGKPAPTGRFDTSWPERTAEELKRAWNQAKEERFFTYKNRDLSLFVNEQIFSGFGDYFKSLIPVLQGYESMLLKAKPKMIVSEDDYALRGGPLAALAKKMNVSYTTVSHANLAVDFQVPPSAQSFRQSIATVVNSANEKQMYVARGWNPAGFEILGTPRYDSLIKMRAARKQEARKVPRLLYCANTYFKPQQPNDYGYLGIHIDSFEKIVRPCAEAILKAVEQSDCEFVIKPHNPEGLKSWTAFISGSPALSRIKLITDPHSQIIDLINDCDAMILSYWSTTIYEALICDVPVIYVDVLGRNIKSVDDFETKGLLKVARTEAEALKIVKDIKVWTGQSIAKNSEFEAEIGRHDGKSTSRVAAFLAEKML